MQRSETEQQIQQQPKHKEQHRLTAISCLSELQELRDLYRKDWPEHCVGYLTLDNFLRWLQKEPEMKNVHIYTLNGDWRSNGLFLIVHRYQLFVGTLCTKNDTNDTNKLLTEAISLLDWTPGYKVSSFLKRHRSAVLSIVSALHLSVEYDSLTVVYHLPASEAAKLHLSSWLYDTNELVAWCLRLQGGFLGALQVKESHKRLGLGTLVASATSRRLARELGQDITACVNRDNEPSCKTFNKLGFKILDTAYWLRTFPTAKGLDWPDGK